MASYSYPFTQADGAPAGWTVHTGSAAVVSNALVLTADFTTDLATADDVLTRDNYEVEADITPGASYGSGQRVGLVMHYQDGGNYYYIWVKAGLYGGVYLYRYKAFTSTLIASDPSAGSRNIPAGTLFNLRVACSDLNGSPAFEVFLNDVSLFSHTDSADPISAATGKIGVNQSSSTGDNATIDNVAVVEGQAAPVVVIGDTDSTAMCALGETTVSRTFNATASDEEDGDLTASLSWQNVWVGNDVVGTLFDPALKDADTTLSLENSVATKSASALGTQTSVLADQPKSSGKWQFEATAKVLAGSNSGIGICGDDTPNFGANLGGAGALGNDPSVAYHKLGRVFWNLGATESNAFISGFNYAANDVISLCADLDVGEVHFYKNGTFVYTRALIAATEWRAGVCFAAIGDQWEITTGDLIHPIAGYSKWDAAPTSTTALGTGGSVSPALEIGTNTITATVTDSNGASSSDSVVYTVQAYAFGGTVPAAGGFIAGDAGAGHTADQYTGDGVRVMITEQPSNGKLFVKHDGSLGFFPNAPGETQITFKYRIQDQGGFSNEATITIDLSAPSCAITLEDYSGLDPAQQYPTVVGQVFSVTDETWTHQEVYVAGTSLAGIAIDWPANEIRIVQLNTRGSSLGYYEAFGAGSSRYDNTARLVITNTAFNKNVIVVLSRDENAGGTWGFLAYGSNGNGFQGVEFSGSILNPTPSASGIDSRLAIGIRGDGHVFFYENGVELTTVYLDGTLQPMAAFDFFDTVTDALILVGQMGPMTSSTSMVPFVASCEGEIVTTGFADTYPAGVKDWCGNALACTAILDGSVGPAFGYGAATVAGLTISIDTSAAPNAYLAASPWATAGERRSLPAPGRICWIQADSFASSGVIGSNARAGFIAFDAAGNPTAFAQVRGGTLNGESAATSIAFETAAGVPIGTVVLPAPLPDLSLGIDSSGEIYYYKRSTLEKRLCSLDEVAVGGAFAGVSTIVLFGMCDITGGGSSSSTVTFTLDAASMTDGAAFTGDEDWCGNII